MFVCLFRFSYFIVLCVCGGGFCVGVACTCSLQKVENKIVLKVWFLLQCSQCPNIYGISSDCPQESNTLFIHSWVFFYFALKLCLGESVKYNIS